MIRFDMSEFGERHTVSPPGRRPSRLRRLRRGRASSPSACGATRTRVVLFDEIEKAHPDVFNLLLQVLDDGRLTDGQGRTVDFRNTVVIMTSQPRLGPHRARRALGFGGGRSRGVARTRTARPVMGKAARALRPEFLNRIDEIVLFRKLDRPAAARDRGLMLGDDRRRLHAQDVALDVTDAAVDWLAEHGYEPEYGARPLRRIIQRERRRPAVAMLLDGRLAPGQQVTVAREGDALAFQVTGSDPAQVPAQQSDQQAAAKQ